MKQYREGPSSKTPKVIFKTPGRECAHANKGCCPKCMDPMWTDRGTPAPVWNRLKARPAR